MSEILLGAGVFSLPWWGLLLVALLTTHVTIVCVTIYLHRHQTHRSLRLHPAVALFMRFWLWTTTGMVTREWVAIHRKHHDKVETESDPHSPRVKGILQVLFCGADLYVKEKASQQTVELYGAGTPDDFLERRLFSCHETWGLISLLVLEFVLFGFWGVAIWSVQMMWVPFFAAGVINGLGHYWGYRNFETRDCSRNLLPFGILIGGEELHNNHHAFPGSARFSLKPWEFDIGWLYVRILEFLGLASDVKAAPRERALQHPQKHDIDWIKKLLNSRLHLMNEYMSTVVQPVLKKELRLADGTERSLLRRARGFFMHHESMISSEDRQAMHKAFKGRESLAAVYEFKCALHQLWQKFRLEQAELHDALIDWCDKAEKAEPEVLRKFAKKVQLLLPSAFPAASEA